MIRVQAWWFWRVVPHDHRWVHSSLTMTSMAYGASPARGEGVVPYWTTETTVPQPDYCALCYREREGV